MVGKKDGMGESEAEKTGTGGEILEVSSGQVVPSDGGNRDALRGVFTKEEARRALLRDDVVGHAVPLGSKTDYRLTAMRLIEVAREETQTVISSPEYVRAFSASLLNGLKVRDRLCMRLWSEMMKMVGMEQRIMVEVWHKLGVSDEDQARQYIQRSKGIEKMSLSDSVEKCLDLVVSYADMNPDFKARAVQRLGGVEAEWTRT